MGGQAEIVVLRGGVPTPEQADRARAFLDAVNRALLAIEQASEKSEPGRLAQQLADAPMTARAGRKRGAR